MFSNFILFFQSEMGQLLVEFAFFFFLIVYYLLIDDTMCVKNLE